MFVMEFVSIDTQAGYNFYFNYLNKLIIFQINHLSKYNILKILNYNNDSLN